MASYFDDTKRVDLREYGRVLLRRVWLVIVPALVALVVAFVASLPRFMPPVYESQSRLVLRMNQRLSGELGEMIPQARASDQIDNIRNLITSTQFLEGMIRKMDDLRNDQGARRWAKDQKDRNPSATEDDLVELYLMRYLRHTIDLGMDRRQPGVFQVKVADFSPHRALRLCERITQAIVDESENTVKETIRVTDGFAREQLATRKETLAAAEEKLRQMEAGQLRQQMNGGTVTDSNILLVDGLRMEIQGQVQDLESMLETRKRRLTEAGQSPSRWMGLSGNAAVSGVVGQYVSLMRNITKNEIQDLSIPGMDTSGSLQVQAAQRRAELRKTYMGLVAAEDGSLPSTVQKDVVSMLITDVDLRGTRARLQSAQAETDAFRGRSAALPGRQMEVDRQRQEVAKLQNLLSMFEEQLMTNNLRESYEANKLGGRLDVLEPPTLPLTPVSPNRPLILGLSAVGGVLLGLLLAFVVEHHDLTIRDVNELPVGMRDQVIGSMPLIRDRITKEREFRKSGMKGQPISLFDYYRDEAASSFEFRRLVLELTRDGRFPESIMTTSSERNEGKTTTSCMLALTIARHRKIKTVLVDLDFRKPSVHKEMGVTRHTPGAAEILNERVMNHQLIRSTPEANLFILPAGSFRQISAETVTPESVRWLIAELKKTFDVVIIDSPPNLAVPDPLVIGQAVETVLFVVKAGSTSQAVLQRGYELQIRANDNVAGVILNNVRDVMPYYYNYEYYGYSAEEAGAEDAASKKAAVGGDAT